RQHQHELVEQQGRLDEKHQQVSQRIRQPADRGDRLLERKDQAEQHLLAAAGKLPGIDPPARLAQLDAMLDEAGQQFDVAADSGALTSRVHQQAISLERSLEQYNQQAQPADMLLHDSPEALHSPGFYEHVGGLRRQLDNL